MKVQTFVSKLSVEAVKDMDDIINDWLKRNEVEPKFITQTHATELQQEGKRAESLIITSIWY